MAAKDVRFSTDARDKMLRGVDILANAVMNEVLIAGVAGLVAGAMSMAAGEDEYPSARNPILNGRISLANARS